MTHKVQRKINQYRWDAYCGYSGSPEKFARGYECGRCKNVSAAKYRRFRGAINLAIEEMASAMGEMIDKMNSKPCAIIELIESSG